MQSFFYEKKITFFSYDTFSYIFIYDCTTPLYFTKFSELCQTEFYLTVSFFAITFSTHTSMYMRFFETKFFHDFSSTIPTCCSEAMTRFLHDRKKNSFRGNFWIGSRERINTISDAGREKRRTCETPLNIHNSSNATPSPGS